MINKNPSKRDYRVFSLVLMIFTIGFGSLAFCKGNMIATYILGGLAAYGLFSLAIVPASIRPVYIAFSYIGLVLGWINTRILLGIIFYLLFTPISLFFKLTGRDALMRKISSAESTYWIEKTALEGGKERYHKQF